MSKLLRVRRLVEYVGEPEAVIAQIERSLRPGNFDTPRGDPKVRITVSQLGNAEFVNGDSVVVAANANAVEAPPLPVLHWVIPEKSGMMGPHYDLKLGDKWVGHFYVDADEGVNVEQVLGIIASTQRTS